MKRRLRSSNGAFTLIELLVVIAIIAILASLLLPALAKAKTEAKKARCIGQNKQWGMAEQMYTADNRDHITTDGWGPNNTYPDYSNGSTGWATCYDPVAWFTLLPPYVSEHPLGWYRASPPAGVSKNEQIMPFPGGRGSPIWHCPDSYMSDAAAEGKTPKAPAGFGHDGYFSLVQNLDLRRIIGSAKSATDIGESYAQTGFASGYPQTMKLSSLVNPCAPAKVVLFFDGAFDPVSEVLHLADKNGVLINASPQYNSVNPAVRFKSLAQRHGKGATINFCDGHSQFYKIEYLLANHAYPLCDAAASLEAPIPDVMWNPAHRSFLGY